MVQAIKWPRLLLCGLAAGGVWVLLSVALVAGVGRDFMHSIPSHHGRPGLTAHVWLFALTMLAAAWAVWIFALIRPNFSSRTKAVLIAALSWWLLALLQSAKWIALLEITVTRALLLGVLMLPAMAVATGVGAWLYEQDGTG